MATKKETYEQAMAKLEQIVAQIESGELNIDRLSAKLKEAKELIDFCRRRLYQVDNEIKKLLETDKEE